MYFYCHVSTLPLCYENNENWPKNFKYLKELPFLMTIFVRSDVITNSTKMFTNTNFKKKRGKFKFPQSPWILGLRRRQYLEKMVETHEEPHTCAFYLFERNSYSSTVLRSFYGLRPLSSQEFGLRLKMHAPEFELINPMSLAL